MTTLDIRKQTYIVIQKNGLYLVGGIIWSSELRWSPYVYDAWRTRKKDRAEEIARKTGGVMVLFNRVTGDRKMIGA